MMKTSSSMRSDGAWDVNRRITIPALVHAADGMAIERVVNTISVFAMFYINVDKHQVVVHYDASKTDYQGFWGC